MGGGFVTEVRLASNVCVLLDPLSSFMSPSDHNSSLTSQFPYAGAGPDTLEPSCISPALFIPDVFSAFLLLSFGLPFIPSNAFLPPISRPHFLFSVWLPLPAFQSVLRSDFAFLLRLFPFLHLFLTHTHSFILRQNDLNSLINLPLFSFDQNP